MILWRADQSYSIVHETIQLSCTVVTGSPAILRCGHGITAEFLWTQIVSPVSAISTAPMGVTTPCITSQPNFQLAESAAAIVLLCAISSLGQTYLMFCCSSLLSYKIDPGGR